MLERKLFKDSPPIVIVSVSVIVAERSVFPECRVAIFVLGPVADAVVVAALLERDIIVNLQLSFLCGWRLDWVSRSRPNVAKYFCGIAAEINQWPVL